MFTPPQHPIEQYRHVGTVTDVGQANPHRLILLLFDGAIAAVLQARHALHTGDMDTKRATVAKAMRIIDEGLRASVENHGDPSLGDRLRSLYDHMVNRLLLANLRSSEAPLAEVARLLGELRGAWAEIAPPPPVTVGALQA